MSNNNVVEPKKRGRKPKKDLLVLEAVVVSAEDLIVEDPENIVLCENDESDIQAEESASQKIPKKRGRKPKGGKIVQQIIPLQSNKEEKPNVILHLKCSMKDLQDNKSINQKIENYDFSANKNESSFEIVSSDIKQPAQSSGAFTKKNAIVSVQDDENDACDDFCKATKDSDADTKEVWRKLKHLEHSLHANNICDKKSACFWCTHDFDNPPVYIPKHHVKDSYHVYGCFCSPECATAYLMEESIDSSSKFERYHLINHIYSKIYDYKKNIKPAPNPYYMLEKYYGNLTIQEYRSLLRNERLFLVVDKPLTRILPELHEDNDDFIINNKIIPSNTYQIKKKQQKKQQTKNAIVSETFGLT